MKNTFRIVYTKRHTLPFFSMFLSLLISTSCGTESDLLAPNEALYIDIPDPNFEAELIKQGIDTDGIINKLILREDAESVSRLDLNLTTNAGKIADLKGIEGFINITLLSAANQNIETVDLSNNTQLDSLYLSGNTLSDIDLSNNKELLLVYLSDNEFDSESTLIGLENAPNLKTLDISWNYLEEFSIHSTSLQVLYISHNDLKSLNTDGAVQLRNIYMPLNQLETVDFSTNTSLETLLVSGNKLQNIDLENNSNLTHLYIIDNQLTNLDVSNNLKLEDLRVERNSNLNCIKIKNGQYIPFVMKSDYQELNASCL